MALHRTSSRHRARSRNIAIAVGLIVWAACNVIVPRQGWDPGYGAVVPHDSFPTDCGLCHVSGDWSAIKQEFTFDHEAETGVPLNGAHEQAACLLCHNDRGPVGAFAARGCAGCHEDVHRGKLGPSCADCHDEIAWLPKEMIARHDRTRLPLVGAHAAAACFACHPGAQVGNFDGLDPRCQTCHLGAALTVTSPDHSAQGWTVDCQRCHREVAWIPARFAHPASFPLTGGHANLACTRCHSPNTYSGLSTQCASCHLDDYQRTNNPNHTTAGYGTNCEACHDTNGWSGANFVHRFPLRGPHDRSCSDCHRTPGNYSQFSCTHCHEHGQSRMADKHSGVRGYSWTSTACLNCHPQGRH